MSYRFELRDGVAASFTRIGTEQIDRVVRDFTATKNADTAIHEGRKSLKRLRALLRVARPAIGETAFKTHNAAFRDIGRAFSADRDRHVLSGVAEKCAAAMGQKYAKPLTAIKATLAKSKSAPQAAAKDSAMSALATVRDSFQKISFKPDSFDSVEAGLKQSYRRGRRQLRQAYAHPTDEDFHDLRKSVQQHWRHMQVLQRAWPDLFVARLSAARRLSQILGDDHDLAVFAAYVVGLPRAAISQAARRDIVRHCQAEQAKLRRLAEPLCQQLYAERAGRFAKRIASIWHAAVRLDEVEAAPAARPAPAVRKAKVPAKSRKPSRRRGNSAQVADAA